VSNDTAKYRLSCAKKYSHILLEENATDLLHLSNDKRIHVMKSLSNLGKFLGCYNKWKLIIDRYQLKWSNENGVDTFNKILNGKYDYSSMLDWLKQAYQALPERYGNALLFNSLTGLRPSEACESIKIIESDVDKYLNKDTMFLEHFRFPDIFIRRTKNAYISIVSEKILDIAKQANKITYTSVKLTLKRRGVEMHMNYCRKIFATYLRSKGIEQEIIDLLQGRIPKNIFVRHYYKPDVRSFNRIREILNELYTVIIQ
ncbi:MAG TPA: integrase, partial [Nitrososphaeraceae archaeon]|nr:integrase [Nitrososphaeraceae archaeon]